MGGSGHAMDATRKLNDLRKGVKSRKSGSFNPKGEHLSYIKKKLRDNYSKGLSKMRISKAKEKAKSEARVSQDRDFLLIFLSFLFIIALIFYLFRDNIFY